jgi:hypothetical protein
MKMSIEQKAAYKAYRRACRVSNIWPTLADFLAGDIPSYVKNFITVDWLALEELQQRPALAELQKATNDLYLAEYNLYCAACGVENVEPVLADFVAGEIPDGVIDLMERQQNGEGAMAAHA